MVVLTDEKGGEEVVENIHFSGHRRLCLSPRGTWCKKLWENNVSAVAVAFL